MIITALNSKQKFILSVFILFFTLGAVHADSEIDRKDDEPGLNNEAASSFKIGTYTEYLETQNRKPAKPGNLLTISEINKQKLSSGCYELEGYVVSIYECPPCPKPGFCSPCPSAEHIIISETPIKLDLHAINDKQMSVFVDSHDKFIVGKKYKFLIKILDVKTTNQPINNAQLIYYKRLKE